MYMERVMCGQVAQFHHKHPSCAWKGKNASLLTKRERRGLQFLGGHLFSPHSSRARCAPGGRMEEPVALRNLCYLSSPLHLRQPLKKSQEEDAGKQRMNLRIQRTNSTGKSWKAWGKYLMQSTGLSPTLSDCISHCIVFNCYSGAMTCSNLFLQLHLGFTWHSLIKIELLGLQNKHLIKAECF